MTTPIDLTLRDLHEIGVALADQLIASETWRKALAKEIGTSIAADKAFRRDVAAEIAASLQPPQVYKPGED